MLDLFRIFSLKDVDNTAEGRLFFLSKWMNFQKKKKPGGHLRSQQIFAGFCIVNGQRPFGLFLEIHTVWKKEKTGLITRKFSNFQYFQMYILTFLAKYNL